MPYTADFRFPARIARAFSATSSESALTNAQIEALSVPVAPEATQVEITLEQGYSFPSAPTSAVIRVHTVQGSTAKNNLTVVQVNNTTVYSGAANTNPNAFTVNVPPKSRIAVTFVPTGGASPTMTGNVRVRELQ